MQCAIPPDLYYPLLTILCHNYLFVRITQTSVVVSQMLIDPDSFHSKYTTQIMLWVKLIHLKHTASGGL